MKYYILFSMKIINVVVFCLSLQAADTTEHDLLRICGNDDQKALTLALGEVPGDTDFSLVIRKLGKDKEARKSGTNEKPFFAITGYPSYNPNPPFIVFGQMQAKSKSETGIISRFAMRKCVSGLLIFHGRSTTCNKKNLDFVQNNFLDDFTDAELLKGRIGSDSELKNLISDQVKKFTKGKGKEKCPITQLESCAGNHVEKVACLLIWLSLQGYSYNRHEMYGFDINFEIDDSSQQGMQQVQGEIGHLPLGGADRVVGSVGFDTAKVKEKVKVEHAEPLNIMIKQCIDQLSNYVKPDYKQPYFLILDAKKALEIESEFGDPLRELEGQLFTQVPSSDVISRYVGLADKGDAKLTENDVLAMLEAGMKIDGKKAEQIGHDV